MDIVSLLISLVSGAISGNVAGAAAPDKSLGTVGNSISGLIGGGLGGYLLQALGILAHATASPETAASNLDISSILANVGSSGVGGALITVIAGLIKNYTQKSS